MLGENWAFAMSLNDVRCFVASWWGWAVVLPAAAVGAYLLWAHTGHVASALPFVLLLLCPLMHLFGHRHGHGKH
jgi:hypothetical protein